MLVPLEQRGAAALPTLAFFFGYVLHVGDVSSRLGEDMVEIVADADEGEAFFEKFADPCGAEQKQSEDDVVLVGVLDQLLGGGVEFG